MIEVTLRIATTTLFGTDLGEQGPLAAIWKSGLRFPRSRHFPLNLPGTPCRRWLNSSHAIDAGIHRVIDAKRASADSGRDVLSMLLGARDEDGCKLSEGELVGHAGVIFAAGHETSSSALS